ncbi:hypothetical protein PILCRDRAFT_826343 [Piloderma croceum F 1598]|uniref:RRM domain-containing protein n=1 Tax=Piloderma croceum (strain F 1598) TaxID=765440 RepID=A0A0C3BG73_PILCF|nr:hypothetical protein PILCRDRAFT_826343 [Piloderma croceum F 1598]
MSALPASIAGFTIIPVTYSSSSTHIIYARPHSGSKKTPKQTLPNGRTLFLVNVPPDTTERELILLFKHAGTVEKVVFDHDGVELPEAEESESESEGEEDAVVEDESQEQPHKKRKVSKDDTGPPKVSPLPRTPLRTLRKTGTCAHVIFLDSSSLERALTTPQKPRPWPRSPDEPSGLAHYMALYDSLRPPLDAVREHADTSMELYEYELARSKQNSSHRKGEAVVDEDGFTLVTRGGAYGKTLGGGVGVANKTFDGSSLNKHGRKKKEGKEKDAFYAFQKAEKQRKAIMDLKKNWEADKAKVEKLKESRRFKPY